MTAGFGLEKFGLLTLKFPRATLLIVAAVTAFLVYGGTLMGFSSDIREIFRSGSADFATLEEVERQYPSGGRNVMILVEGENLFRPETLEQLQVLHLDLGLVDGVTSTLSMFSARYPPDASGKTASLFPPEFSASDDMAALRKLVLEHPLVSGRLVSKDGNLGLFVISLDRKYSDVEALRVRIDEIESLTRETLADSGLTLTLTGSSVMRVEIIGALIRDQQTFRLLGLGVATLLCWLFFRSLPYVVIALAPAALAIIGLKGGMGLAGQDINVLTNVIPGLVLVIAFASALHILFAIRRKLGRSKDLEEAIGEAVIEVGPACVLTSATTTIALLSLTMVPHPFITGFGLTAAMGTAFTFVAIMATVPPLALLLLGKMGPIEAGWGKAESIHRSFQSVSGICATLVRQNPAVIAAIGVALAVVCGAFYSQNKPQYQYQDNLPKGSPAFQAIEKINAKLSGVNTLKLLIRWAPDASPDATQNLQLIREAHEVVAAAPVMKLVSSMHSVQSWYDAGNRSNDDLLTFLDKTKTPLSRRLLSPEYNSALVTGYFGSIPATDLVAAIKVLDRALDKLRERNPGATLALTGLVPVSAHASTDMINQLSWSLLAAVAVIIVLIGFAYRSVFAGLASILPNVLPIFIAGAWLYLSDRGMQFTSVVAFTIGFGIAVDSTIHVLNRYRLAKEELGSSTDAMQLTITTIGSVLIVSTLVLMAGIGGTVFSELPMVQLYGQVIILLLATALVGDMLFLPAIIRVVDDWLRKEDNEAGKAAEKRKAPRAGTGAKNGKARRARAGVAKGKTVTARTGGTKRKPGRATTAKAR